MEGSAHLCLRQADLSWSDASWVCFTEVVSATYGGGAGGHVISMAQDCLAELQTHNMRGAAHMCIPQL